MATSSQDEERLKNVTSVSAGGESVTIDNNAQKADDRARRNRDPKSIVNRQTRPVFGSINGAYPS